MLDYNKINPRGYNLKYGYKIKDEDWASLNYLGYGAEDIDRMYGEEHKSDEYERQEQEARKALLEKQYEEENYEYNNFAAPALLEAPQSFVAEPKPKFDMAEGIKLVNDIFGKKKPEQTPPLLMDYLFGKQENLANNNSINDIVDKAISNNFNPKQAEPINVSANNLVENMEIGKYLNNELESADQTPWALRNGGLPDELKFDPKNYSINPDMKSEWDSNNSVKRTKDPKGEFYITNPSPNTTFEAPYKNEEKISKNIAKYREIADNLITIASQLVPDKRIAAIAVGAAVANDVIFDIIEAKMLNDGQYPWNDGGDFTLDVYKRTVKETVSSGVLDYIANKMKLSKYDSILLEVGANEIFKNKFGTNDKK